MKFISTRDLRNRPGFVRDLAPTDEVVLMANGKPVGILLGVDEDRLEYTLRAIRHAKSTMALSELRKDAARRGLNKLTDDEINAEIRAVRSQRK